MILAMGQGRLAFVMALTGLSLALLGPSSAGAQSGAAVDSAALHMPSGGEPVEQVAPLPSAGAIASVAVAAEVRGTRLIIVDDEGVVLAIWSNTSAPDCDLVVREMGVNGPERAAVGTLLRRYRGLVEDVDWTRRGLVYSRSP